MQDDMSPGKFVATWAVMLAFDAFVLFCIWQGIKALARVLS